MKKQIVFIESNPTIYSYKLARTFRLSNKYETILVSFSKVDEEFFGKAYDKIISINLSHKINIKNMFNFIFTIFSKKLRRFIKEIKELNPMLFQITGPDLFTYLSFFIVKNKPVVYFAYDIWEFYDKKISFKNPGIKEFFQKKIEKSCFKMADGILHKGPEGELKYLSYKVNKPDLSLLPGCLDEWTYAPKNKQKNKEIHLAYAGGPLASDSRTPFIKIVRIITSQKIHFHTFGSCVVKSEEPVFKKEEKNNPYFHFNKSEKADNLNKRIMNYDFGIIPDFYDHNKININSLHMQVSMPNKLFNYLEAGIPSIVPKESKFLFQVTMENKIGFGILEEDLKNLREIIEKQDYKKMQKDIVNAQNFLKMSRLIKSLEQLYEKVLIRKNF